MANQVAYGFQNLLDRGDQLVTAVGVGEVARAIEQSVAEHDRQMNSLLELFVQRTTEFKTRYRTPATARLQPLDENGRALPIKAAAQYDVSLPLQMAGTAWGSDYVARAKMTVQQAANATATMMMADMRWMRDHILAALFLNTTWSWTDPEHGALTMVGLANADSTVYQVQAGADAGATAQHYLAQAAAIADGSNPFPAMRDLLAKHPENGGEIIAFIPTNLRAAVAGLANFRPLSDPNIRLGSGSSALVGDLGVAVPGVLFGYETSKVWLVEWASLPSNYIIAVASQGPRPLFMREDPVPQLQGFVRVADRDDHPWYEQQYLRIAGFGANNRVGAVVQRIGNAAYAIPTGYTSPMP